MAKANELWTGRVGFILATIGSAVGLGSIWKFPYEVGSNGGSTFIIFYLLGLALVVAPLMLAEFAIGRRGRSDAAESFAAVAIASGASRRWSSLGLLGVVTSFLILSFYSVIGGWAAAYVVETFTNGLPGPEREAVQHRFDALLAAPVRLAAYHAAFLAVTAAVVGRGIVEGIEGASKLLMPALVFLIALLAGYSIAYGDTAATLRFLFTLDLDRLTAAAALKALGLGFFSIGVGLAVMITYAAYANEEVNLRQVTIATIVGDTAVSFLAGLAIFPLVFAHGLDPASGPGLMFVTLPLAFARMPLGHAAAIAFFVLLVIAAVASAMSMLEMSVALLRHRFRWSRPRAAAAAAAACWVAGLTTVFSFNLWADWYPLSAIPGFANATVFGLIDHLASNVMLPAGGFGLAIFAGWIIPARVLAEELGLGTTQVRILRVLLRYVAPITVAGVTFAPFIV